MTLPRATPVTGTKGEIAHPLSVAQNEVYAARVHQVTDDVFCAVGFGVSNCTLVRGPEGAVIIDTGECKEELGDILDAFGPRLDRPIVGVIYSHSHYVWGTTALHERGFDQLEIWGHEDITTTIADVGAEIGPAYLRRMRLQFGYGLPDLGPDAMGNVGIGAFFFRRGPKTGGFLPPTRTVPRSGPVEIDLAGLRWHFEALPADSEDTIVIHLPDLGVVINNHLWPTLFNIYPLRGERYRDPQVLLPAFAAIRGMEPEHLVGTHGIPISGRERCRAAIDAHRDSIQYLWDQTVRGINRGLAPDDLAESVVLPPRLAESPWIQPLYGEAPFHVRQIYNGLFGWFGTDTATLHPVSPYRRAELLVDGMGGHDAVVVAARDAVERDEHEWAAELCSHMLRLSPDDAEVRALKAFCLRYLAQRTPAANTRSHYLHEALTLEGVIDPMAETPFVPTVGSVMRMGALRSVTSLRVQLDPIASADTDLCLVVRFVGAGEEPGSSEPGSDAVVHGSAWLHVVGGVARFGDGEPARIDLAIEVTPLEWARLRARRVSLAEADVIVSCGTLEQVGDFFALFDHGPR